MKIIWLCNSALPQISEDLGRNANNAGGWLVGLSNNLKKLSNIDLTIVFPNVQDNNFLKGKVDNIKYYGFPKKKLDPTKYDKTVEDKFKKILNEEKPDIVHIFGTEFPHSLSMMKVFNKPEKTVINIQGLCSIYAKHYLNGIPKKIQASFTLRDLIRRDSILKQKEKFKKRGIFEIESIKRSIHIIGRTTWDKTAVHQINHNVNYHFCNEILRNEFYKNKWDINKCEKYSIFVSQGNYPIKGLHFVLEAMPFIIQKFPEAHLYIGGADVTKNNTLKDKIKISSYGKYILYLIENLNLKKYITFTGNLDEKQICNRFLKSNVFLSASNIENSPNSLGEAMILGVPSVSSYVGGVPDMMEHKNQGFIYQTDAPYMLANYICEIFDDEELAIKFSKAARKKALITHNKQINTDIMLKIYNDILGVV